MAAILVREMRKKDLGRVSELSAQLGYPVPVNILEDRFSRIVDDPGQALFVAESGTRVVGWTHVHPRWFLESEPYAEIAALVVDQEARRVGAGRALISEVQRWARERSLGTFEFGQTSTGMRRTSSTRRWASLG